MQVLNYSITTPSSLKAKVKPQSTYIRSSVFVNDLQKIYSAHVILADSFDKETELKELERKLSTTTQSLPQYQP